MTTQLNALKSSVIVTRETSLSSSRDYGFRGGLFFYLLGFVVWVCLNIGFIASNIANDISTSGKG